MVERGTGRRAVARRWLVWMSTMPRARQALDLLERVHGLLRRQAVAARRAVDPVAEREQVLLQRDDRGARVAPGESSGVLNGSGATSIR